MHYMNGIASELHTYGGLLLGARLRRLSDQLYAATDEIYREHGVTIPSGAVALLLLLRDQNRALSIGEVARRMGQSHVAISRVTRALSRAGVIGETGDARDQRVVMLMLLPRGRALLEAAAADARCDGRGCRTDRGGGRAVASGARARGGARRAGLCGACAGAKKQTAQPKSRRLKTAAYRPGRWRKSLNPYILVGGLDR